VFLGGTSAALQVPRAGLQLGKGVGHRLRHFAVPAIDKLKS